MNRRQALEQLKQGHRITHITFMTGEFIKMVSDKIVTEVNRLFENRFFEEEGFEDGWEIYNEQD